MLILRPDNVILDHTKLKYHSQIQIWSISGIIHRAFYYIDSTNSVATERAAESILTKGRQRQARSMFVRRHCVAYNANINSKDVITHSIIIYVYKYVHPYNVFTTVQCYWRDRIYTMGCRMSWATKPEVRKQNELKSLHKTKNTNFHREELTDAQKEIVKETWNIVREDIAKVGVVTFLR